MLSNSLADILVQKRIITPNTQLEVKFNRVDMSGSYSQAVDFFTVLDSKTEYETGKVFFKLSRIGNGQEIVAQADQIVSIDGMPPENVAKAFDLKVDGSNQQLGKRRGRPKKIRG